MSALTGLVGRELELRFNPENATPDLHEVGAITLRVSAVELVGSPPAPKITGVVLSPELMRGLKAALTLRYEGETIEQALGGREVTVTALFEEQGGRAVAGGLGTMVAASR